MIFCFENIHIQVLYSYSFYFIDNHVYSVQFGIALCVISLFIMLLKRGFGIFKSQLFSFVDVSLDDIQSIEINTLDNALNLANCLPRANLCNLYQNVHLFTQIRVDKISIIGQPVLFFMRIISFQSQTNPWTLNSTFLLKVLPTKLKVS